ncbi:hypothetical protein ACR78F_10850 [Sphingobacterium spiritivorum]|uniref:hypothetical protein n=1 Tax=Sphingobacterium spiritivorum TaxID=258 RepID=UPI003DA446F0
MCQSILLSEKGTTHVSLCNKCQTFYIWQSSFVLTFTRRQFETFVETTLSQGNNHCFVSFPDGEFRLLLNTPCPEIVFNFRKEEWDDFVEALTESFYMQEVYSMIEKS